MKEKLEDREKLKEEESEILLYNELYDNNQEKNLNKIINIKIFDSDNKKVETYKLLNEENEILLCKEEEINKIKTMKENDEDIKIKELYKGQDNDSFYYLNKNHIKQKLLKNSMEFERTFSNSSIDNNDDYEMEKLYKETQLEHPRRIIDGKIKRYPFFSWSGFFCCNKYDYSSLGLGYTTYFNTIKLSIIFFLIIFLINLVSILECTKYNSIYDFNKDDILLKTTLGNSVIRYFNYTYAYCSIEYCDLNVTLYCENSSINDIIAVRRYYNVDSNFLSHLSYLNKENNYKMGKEFKELEFSNYYFKKIKNKKLDINHGRGKSKLTINLPDWWFYDDFEFNEFYDIENTVDLIYYSCLNISNYRDTTSEEESNLITIIMVITLITLIILIIFYYTYKKAISRDNKEYQKNKIFINDYTLVLHKLKIISDDYNHEINDLISFLNSILNSYNFLFKKDNENSKEINDINIFDISISNVNDKKIKIFEKIKSLQNKIEDIVNDNDSIKNKIKNNIRKVYLSMHNIVENLSNNDEKKEENEDNQKSKNNILNKESTLQIDKINEREKEKKIEEKRIELNENKEKIINDIILLHKEYNLKNYVDIYITFRNKIIKNFIYGIYNKNKIIRFFYYISCQSHKLKKYYYKNQWLNFNLAIDNPSDIQWENCYISTCKKIWRRILSVLISMAIVITIIIIHVVTNSYYEEKEAVMNTLFVIIIQIIGIGSCFLFHKLIIFEKFSSKSKDLSSFVDKYFSLNFLINIVVLIRNENYPIFSYLKSEKYFINNKIIMSNIISSIFTSQLSSLFFYLFNLIKRFSDSKCSDGRITRYTDKIKYKNLYIGPEFPFDERYGQIFTIMEICLLFGANCPIIFFFLVCFLIMTFIIDKFLIINYYKKPQFLGSFLSKKILNYFGLGVFIYLYGLFYNLSNPYLFNNELLKQNYEDNKIIETIKNFDFLLSPITLIYLPIFESDLQIEKRRIIYYNFNLILLIHFFVFIFTFANPTSIIRKKLSPKIKLSSFLNISQIEIGQIYSLENLEKYYDMKKLQLFDLIIDCDNKNKVKDDYRDLINNIMKVMKYIRQNIKKKSDKKEDIIINNDFEKLGDEYTKLKEESIIKRNKYNITGDISYNQSFIPKYEIYNNFNLMKNL